MSGEKRTPLEIAQQDIRMLERQMATMRSNHKNALRQSRLECEAEIKRISRINREREETMNKHINAMSSEIRQTRKLHQQEMQKQAQEFVRMQQQQAESFETAQRAIYTQLSQSIAETNQYVEKIRQSHAQQIGQLRNNMNRLILNQNRNNQQAGILLKNLNCEIEVIRTMPYQKFYPEKMRQILSHIQGIQHYPSETQISIAHTAIKDLLFLEEEIENARIRYESVHLQLLQTIDYILAEIKHNRSNLFFEDTNGNKGEQIDIDFWTNGKYSELETLLTNLRTNIKEGYSDPDLNLDILEETSKMVEDMQEKQNLLVKEAIEKGNASAMRAAIAEKIAQVLQTTHCYEIEDYGYEQQDPRKSFLVKMHNKNNDSDIIVLVYPEDTRKQQLILKTKSNGYISERDLYTRATEINNELKAVGIEIKEQPSEVNPENDHSLDGLYDIAAILKEKGNGIPKNILTNAGLHPTKEKETKLLF